jgi:hypothetical protein
LRRAAAGYGDGVMTPTEGFITSGFALALGCGALVLSQTRWRRSASVRVVSSLVGAVFCLGGVIWLLLSLAAYGGD